MFTEADLRKLEDELRARGVKDVKLSLDPSVERRPELLPVVINDACVALRAYLDGDHSELKPQDIDLQYSYDDRKPRC